MAKQVCERKHSAPALKLWNVEDKCFELYLLIGGEWYFIPISSYGNYKSSLRFRSITYIVNSGARMACPEISFAKWAGRKINWKRETFILHWTTQMVDVQVPF